MYNRRRSVHRRVSRGRRMPKAGLAPVIMILCLSVLCGYATARYVVEPVVNYVPQVSERISGSKTADKDDAEQKNTDRVKETEKASEATDRNVVEDGAAVEQKGDIKGYALQFGCYSSRAAAETAAGELGESGTEVTEQNDMYKILGKIYDNKEDARKALDGLDDPSKAFVTPVYSQ